MANQDTPLMRQYHEVKSRHQDSLLMFRMGDFYELFFDDALVAAPILEIALTSRNKNDPDPVPMCGVPHHSATGYINRLVAAGRKVAICEQLEEPTPGKGIVKRDVTRIISPGTRLDPDSLEAKAPNYTHAAIKLGGGGVVWATCDFTTGKLWFGSAASPSDWLALAQSQGPAELLFPESDGGSTLLTSWRETSPLVFAQTVPAFYFDAPYASDRLKEQFEVANLAAVHPALAREPSAAGALVKYFQETQKSPRVPSMSKAELWGVDRAMELDAATIRALELLPSKQMSASSGRDVSLLSWIDRTRTAMGGRLLREWLLRPLADRDLIEARLSQVERLTQLFKALQPILGEIYDLERLLSRLSLGGGSHASARELLAMARSIEKAQALLEPLKPAAELEAMLAAPLAKELVGLAQATLDVLSDSPPPTTREGGIFRKGFDPKLDELIELSENGEQWLAEFEARERKATAINSLKVRFNRVFGYYIEITKANLASVPLHYVRKQTMVGGERYITEELKNFEEKILTAEKRRCDMEHALFREFCGKFTVQSGRIVDTARAVAHVDAVCSLAQLAREQNYVRPMLDDSLELAIEDGRHPTVSTFMKFVPNSVSLTEAQPFLLITGPNMGGKSTVMRQTALISLLAQIGSFVPAKACRLGVVDRIFTRIGASDNIAEGASTFMVEMSEMSYILRHATRRSLVLIDEVGRGTSTYDGMSLAWALALDLSSRIGSRTLFATHYHELTRLASECPAISNARVAVAVKGGEAGQPQIRFLYKLESGVAERSYGILVARLAGLPEPVLTSAEELLAKLEAEPRAGAKTLDASFNQLSFALGRTPKPKPQPPQGPRPVEVWLSSLEVNTLTPLQALVQLAEWKERVGKDVRTTEGLLPR